jgi:cyclic pyranopterin phosphate synthase
MSKPIFSCKIYFYLVETSNELINCLKKACLNPCNDAPMPLIITSMPNSKLTHLDENGRFRMVDVGNKSVTERIAVAKGQVVMRLETLALIQQGALKKGDVISVAQLAGVMAAKRTAELIPLCHPLPLNQILVDVVPSNALPGMEITATVRTSAKTGVEMEALTAVSVAALTVYDMAKAAEKTMRIENIRLVEKRGGQSGDVKLELE